MDPDIELELDTRDWGRNRGGFWYVVSWFEGPWPWQSHSQEPLYFGGGGCCLRISTFGFGGGGPEEE